MKRGWRRRRMVIHGVLALGGALALAVANLPWIFGGLLLLGIMLLSYRRDTLARMNETFADQHARLSRSEFLYRLLADNTSDIITRVHLDGRPLYVSPSVRAILGWTPEEMMRPDWQRHVHPEDLPRFLETSAKMRAGEERMTDTYRYQRRDGDWCWIEARLHLVRADDGRPMEFVANLRDITRQMHAERALETALADLAEQAATDGLTGVANRPRFDTALDREWRRSLRLGESIALLLIDVDQFKAYNDRYGHKIGDDCLRATAPTLTSQIRRSHDLCARYGGDAFAVILPGTSRDGARDVAERMRAAIEALDLPHEANADGVVTVSIGVAAVTVDRDDATSDLVEAAGAALYRAKRAGRNRVEDSTGTQTATVIALLPHLRGAARAGVRAGAAKHSVNWRIIH